MTTTAPPPLPPGAEVRYDDWWEDDPQDFRVIYGLTRELSEVTEEGKPAAEVQTSAVQFRDGSINTSDDPPQIQVYTYSDNGLGSTQARELAAVLIEAADEVDGWVGK